MDLETIGFNEVHIECVFKHINSYYQFDSDSECHVQDKFCIDSLKVKTNLNQTILNEFTEKAIQKNSEDKCVIGLDIIVSY